MCLLLPGAGVPCSPIGPEGTRTTESSEERQARPRAGETQKGGRGGGRRAMPTPKHVERESSVPAWTVAAVEPNMVK